MNEVTGGGVPASIWREFMESTQRGVQVSALPGAYTPVAAATGSIGTWPFDEEPNAEPEDKRGFFDRLFGRSASGEEDTGRRPNIRPGRPTWR